jgi:hypothetical protein
MTLVIRIMVPSSLGEPKLLVYRRGRCSITTESPASRLARAGVTAPARLPFEVGSRVFSSSVGTARRDTVTRAWVEENRAVDLAVGRGRTVHGAPRGEHEVNVGSDGLTAPHDMLCAVGAAS